jgi:hypothetical protein
MIDAAIRGRHKNRQKEILTTTTVVGTIVLN